MPGSVNDDDNTAMERQLLPGPTETPVSETGLDATPTGITVEEVLGLDVMVGAKLLAGGDGLGRLITRVNVMEVPDLLPWVRPNELLLTTGYPLQQHGDLVAWVRELDAHGLARLREALEESPLPYRCDVLDASALPEGPLREAVLRDALPVWGDLASEVAFPRR